MKISKFKDVDNIDEKEHKKKVENKLDLLHSQDLTLHQQLITENDSNLQELIENQEYNHGELIDQNSGFHAELIGQNSDLHDELIAQNSTLHTAVDEDLETIKLGISGLQARSERTKIFNQKINEDFVIMETTDALMNLPYECADIFNPATPLREVNQYFILEEGMDEYHCSQRQYNFDTDNKYAIRLDQYSGDSLGYFEAYGHQENNSSDVQIVNDTLYKLRLRLDDVPADMPLEDGFSIAFNDIEEDNILAFKREHTISGYMIRYIVEGKMNS